MRVKYAAGIVKNRVTADRRVTCAIEHVGSIPSFRRSAHLVTPLPCCSFSHSSAYSSVLLPQNFPPTSHDDLPRRLLLLLLFLFPFRFIHRVDNGEGEDPRNESKRKRRAESGERELREFPNDFGTNHSRHAFFLGGLCLVLGGLLLALRKREAAAAAAAFFFFFSSPLGTDRNETKRNETKNLEASPRSFALETETNNTATQLPVIVPARE